MDGDALGLNLDLDEGGFLGASAIGLPAPSQTHASAAGCAPRCASSPGRWVRPWTGAPRCWPRRQRGSCFALAAVRLGPGRRSFAWLQRLSSATSSRPWQPVLSDFPSCGAGPPQDGTQLSGLVGRQLRQRRSRAVPRVFSLCPAWTPPGWRARKPRRPSRARASAAPSILTSLCSRRDSLASFFARYALRPLRRGAPAGRSPCPAGPPPCRAGDSVRSDLMVSCSGDRSSGAPRRSRRGSATLQRPRRPGLAQPGVLLAHASRQADAMPASEWSFSRRATAASPELRSRGLPSSSPRRRSTCRDSLEPVHKAASMRAQFRPCTASTSAGARRCALPAPRGVRLLIPDRQHGACTATAARDEWSPRPRPAICAKTFQPPLTERMALPVSIRRFDRPRLGHRNGMAAQDQRSALTGAIRCQATPPTR